MRHKLVRLLAPAIAVVASLALAGVARAGASHAQIEGSGSSWSSNAVNQWIADVDSKGLKVVFSASGSAIGRKDYANKTTDFAVSDIGYAGTDQFGGVDNSNGRSYAYLPVVAGGTAFPYQVKVAGQLKRNIRLSGETLAKIFTNKITNWNDPLITADNNGSALPSLPIIPVVHSEGSGSTAQFTRYLDKMYPDLWRPFQGSAGLTEFFPRKGNQIAQNGSDGVMNFVSSAAANGAIGYDEYSYALGKNYPVAKIGNTAGFFTAPTQYNVAVALTQAKINQDKSSPDYLLQNLDDVYRYNDPRTYPLSSYSYMIIPTAADDVRMTTAKRQTIADFLYYSTCEGQAEMGPLGYSPLPINLAQASFDQVARLKQADPNVDLSSRDVTTCHNPTFVSGEPTRNYLAEVAAQPAACDKAGQGPCTGSEGTNVANPGSGGSAGTGGDAGGSAGSTGATAGGPNVAEVEASGAAGSGGSGSISDEGQAQTVATQLPVGHSIGTGALGVIAALLLIGLLVGPPLLVRRFDDFDDFGGPGGPRQ